MPGAAGPKSIIMTEKKSYRFLTGPDDASFCQRVSDALADGYVLYGDPVMVVSEGQRLCGQAVILPAHAPAHMANKGAGGGGRADD